LTDLSSDRSSQTWLRRRRPTHPDSISDKLAFKSWQFVYNTTAPQTLPGKSLTAKRKDSSTQVSKEQQSETLFSTVHPQALILIGRVFVRAMKADELNTKNQHHHKSAD
jgi:hypothetical protein